MKTILLITMLAAFTSCRQTVDQKQKINPETPAFKQTQKPADNANYQRISKSDSKKAMD